MQTDLLCLYLSWNSMSMGRYFSSLHSIFVLDTGSQIRWSVFGLTM